MARPYSMLHEVKIKSHPSKVFAAITTVDGLKGWWTNDAEAKKGRLNFYFHKRSAMFEMKIDKILKNKLVEWTCVGKDKEWIGTRLVFELEYENKMTILRFSHSGWKSISGYFRMCNTTWGHLMIVLKNYLEGKNPGPYFK